MAQVRESEDGLFHSAVEHAGSPIGAWASKKETPRRVILSPDYARAVERQPLALARAVLQCFHSWAEVGGYFLDDFGPHQFALVPDDRHPRFCIADYNL